MQLDPSAFVADSDLIQVLGNRAEPLACQQDRVLFHQGDAPSGLFLLYKGEATITMASETGTSLVASKAGSGSILGLPGLLGNSPYTLTVTAMAGANVGFVSRDRFTELLQSDPQLLLKILRVLAAEVRTARQAFNQM
ncbi:MAG: cyclic nucleotide-binding domain-containing protein [Terracidiphilus sp.]|nr:cyclic nucleotide-binding domain-containing protein [Terracidiphilus sp.]